MSVDSIPGNRVLTLTHNKQDGLSSSQVQSQKPPQFQKPQHAQHYIKFKCDIQQNVNFCQLAGGHLTTKSNKVLLLHSPLVDCGPPGNPRNGSVASYTGTTNGSVAFYDCNPGLVPVMGMRAMCTGNGWSPNPADLSCTIGTQSVITGECLCIVENCQSYKFSTNPYQTFRENCILIFAHVHLPRLPFPLH